MISNLLRLRAEETAAQIPELKQRALETAFHILQGTHARRKSGAGEAFWQFREYQPGDLPRDIDWRQSGKTDKVYIRQSEQHTPQSHIFWCKRNEDMGFKSDQAPHSKYEAAALLSLSLALAHTRLGDAVSYANLHRGGHSERTLTRFESFLHQNEDDVTPPQIIPKNASCLFFSDFLDTPEALEAQLKPLSQKSRNGLLVQILDPAEIDLPFSGRMLFEEFAGDTRNLINNVGDIRGAYTKRIYGHIESIGKLAASLGWRHVLHRTDTDVKFTALKIWLEGAE